MGPYARAKRDLGPKHPTGRHARAQREFRPKHPTGAAVTTTENSDLEPIRRRDDLLLPFVEACKPRSAWRIGPEAEKAGVFETTRLPIPYHGERSVLAVLQELVKKQGWQVEREHEGAPVIALARRGASVTL